MSATEVIYTDEFGDWFDGLDDADSKKILKWVDLLAATGVQLGHPYSSAINGSKYAIRELRQDGETLRLFYIFDPRREVVLLLGGDKAGDKSFYERMVPKAEAIWEQYLREQGFVK